LRHALLMETARVQMERNKQADQQSVGKSNPWHHSHPAGVKEGPLTSRGREQPPWLRGLCPGKNGEVIGYTDGLGRVNGDAAK